MAKQKRTDNLQANLFRKHFMLAPLTVGVASVMLSGCGDRQDATVYTSIDECTRNNPDLVQQCQAAYEAALEEAKRTGPKYSTQAACEEEFGYNQCNPVQQSSGGSFFMPFMAGYMLSNLMNPGYSQPMYTSYSPYSPYRYRWMTADGYDYGDMRKRNLKVDQDAFKPKPTVNRTMSRGGFGSTVRAKSSWGSSGKSSWGG